MSSTRNHSSIQALNNRAQELTDKQAAVGLDPDEVRELDRSLDLLDEITNIAPDASAQPRIRPASSMHTPEFGGVALGARRDGFTAMHFGHVRSERTQFRSAGDFLRVAAMNLHDPRMFTNAAAGQSVEVGEEGGFAVPPQFSARLLDMAAERSLFMQRASVIPAQSNQITLPAWESDRTGGKRGALTGVWLAEATATTVQKAKMIPMTIRLNKVGTWLSLTSEMMEDAPATSRQIETLAANAIAAALDLACVQGNGVGKPLGIVGAPGTIEQAAEASQTADTVWPENVVKMLSRLKPSSFARAVWLIHPSVIPSLYLLTVRIKNAAADNFVGGYAPPWFQVLADGTMMLLGRPVIATDACKPIGDVGDIILADLSEYLLLARNSLRVEQALGPGWLTDEISMRVVLRVGGQPQPNEAVKLADGTNTVSSLVTLAAR